MSRTTTISVVVRLSPVHGASVLEQILHCFNMTRPRFSQDLSPVITAKMAIIFFNSSITGQPRAMLVMLMAGRIWPFMSPSIAEQLPSPYDIAGPTLTSAVDVIRVDPQEEAEQLYMRMEVEQIHFNRYQYMPWFMTPKLNDDIKRQIEIHRLTCLSFVENE